MIDINACKKCEHFGSVVYVAASINSPMYGKRAVSCAHRAGIVYPSYNCAINVELSKAIQNEQKQP